MVMQVLAVLTEHMYPVSGVLCVAQLDLMFPKQNSRMGSMHWSERARPVLLGLMEQEELLKILECSPTVCAHVQLGSTA